MPILIIFTPCMLMSPKPAPLTAPPLKARLLCMVYESMLLFGVVFIGAWLFSTLLQQRHALVMRNELQVWLFLVLGMYFTWFWTHGGQTLAMKTWRIRLTTSDGANLSWRQASLRYLLAWLWLVPGLALAQLLGAKGSMLLYIPALNFLLWSMTVFLDPERQFLHDRIVKTRIIAVPVPPKTPSADQA